MNKPTILFMGTPEFAVAPLASLLKEGYPLLGVVTQPDRPRGRGQQESFGPVKTLALAQRLPIFQPERVSEENFLLLLGKLRPDAIVVAAFGQLLPPAILKAAPLGCLNIHPSLLPKYRGAAPISRAIMAGEATTGVTIMLLDEGMDSGPILLQEEIAIKKEENFGSLQDRLSHKGADLLLQAIPQLMAGSLTPVPQDHRLATFAPRIRKEELLIDWSQDATSIVNKIRALSPAPGAHTYAAGKLLKILSARECQMAPGKPPGAVIFTREGIAVAAADGAVSLESLQWENKRALPVTAFKAGFRLPEGTILGC